jgi:type II secretory pathway pseudopilin PulG
MKAKHNLAGFSFLEILVVFVILGLTLAMIVSATGFGSGYNSHASLKRQAVNYARATLESLKNEVHLDRWDTGSLAVGVHNHVLQNSEFITRRNGLRFYISAPGPGPLTDMRTVTVVVQWDDFND